MSGARAIRHLVANAAGVTAIAPAARIFSGPIPQRTAVSALGVGEISGAERQTVAMSETNRLRTQRVQVTIHADTYPNQKALLEAIRAACTHRTGVVNGVDVLSILPGGEGPDGFDGPDPAIYQQTIDFLVTFRSA